MKQVFRLMGMPDRVIAFDELPAEYLEGLDLSDCGKLPRHWRDFIGLSERKIDVKPELNPITRKLETFPPLIEKGYFAYLIDWEINRDKDRWREIVSYVNVNAPLSWTGQDGAPVRRMDDVEKMALKMAPDQASELTLEPEEVIIIPLPKVAVQKEPETSTVTLAPKESFKCAECPKEYDSKQALRMHRMKKHAERKETVTV